MRDLDATQQTSPKPVSRMSVETTHPPNEHASILKRLDKCLWSEIRDLDETPIFNFIKVNETQANPSIKILPTAL